VVLVLLAGRFVWIMRMNRRAAKHARKRKKGVSQYYYKKRR
jgi:hypothetical protein